MPSVNSVLPWIDFRTHKAHAPQIICDLCQPPLDLSLSFPPKKSLSVFFRSLPRPTLFGDTLHY